ncbi:hypothetical protein KBX37_27940 [Micromonospora sp. U56]|uniref:hypothetical protein n=1 Tax=Micromonospora sp. U56 TaxID=2824900 RepID=UPI001B38DB59|nr:hypothetical protein [Micromonospora sp. U56]MBQ0896881.1 hypothetical protein [Micromonospora sp. U56]
MDSEELKTRAQALRAAGKTPKQIAKALGVTRATVTPLVRGVAVDRPGRKGPADLPLLGCWISSGWSAGLIIEDRPADWVDNEDTSPLATAGLVSVAVARRDGDSASLCGYLVDTYCLGVKNAVPSTALVDEQDLLLFLGDFFSAYDDAPLRAPIELAQDLVFGAVDFARNLGFDPHRDYYSAAAHLGVWQPPSRITFGLEGKPYFQQGPYDNTARVIRTLDRSVGPGNYHFTAVAEL